MSVQLMAYVNHGKEDNLPAMEMTAMDQKKEFILLWKSGQYSFSRKTQKINSEYQ